MKLEILKVPFYKAVSLFESEKYQEAFEEFMKCAKMGNLYAPFYIRHLVQKSKDLKIAPENQAYIDDLKKHLERIPMKERPDAWMLASLQIIRCKSTADFKTRKKIIAELEKFKDHASNAMIFLFDYYPEAAKLKPGSAAEMQAKVSQISLKILSSADIFLSYHIDEKSKTIIPFSLYPFANEFPVIEKFAFLAYSKSGDIERLLAKYYGPMVKSSPFKSDSHRMYQWQVRAAYMGCREIQFSFSQSALNGRSEQERLQWLTLAAMNGEPQAQILYANHYALFDATPENLKLARDLFEKAIAAKTPESLIPSDALIGLAYLGLGKMQEEGQANFEKDDVAALALYQKSLSFKCPRAYRNIGIFYEQGRGGLTKNNQTAIQFYEDALILEPESPLPDPEMVTQIHAQLGDMYLYGRPDFEAKPEKAIPHLELVLETDSSAKNNYGKMLYFGHGIQKNEALGLRYMVEAAERGNNMEAWTLASLFINGSIKKPSDYKLTPEKIEKYLKQSKDDPTKFDLLRKLYWKFFAHTRYQEAYELILQGETEGDLFSHYILGLLHEYGHENLKIVKDEKCALEYYSLAKDHPLAQNNKGYLLMNGLGCTRDYKTAKTCFENDLAQGVLYAAYNLYFLYKDGLGLEKPDPETAFKYLKQAEASKDPDVYYQLSYAYKEGIGTAPDPKLSMEYLNMSFKAGSTQAARALAAIKLNSWLAGIMTLETKDLQDIYEKLKVSADQGFAQDLFLKNIVGLMLDPSSLPKVVAELRRAVAKKPHKRSSEFLEYIGEKTSLGINEVVGIGFTTLSIKEIQNRIAEHERKTKQEHSDKLQKSKETQAKDEQIGDAETPEQRSLRLRALRLEAEMEHFSDPRNRKSINLKDFNWLMGRIIQLDEVDGSIKRSKGSNISYTVSTSKPQDSKEARSLHFQYHPTHSSGSGADSKKDPKRAMKKQEFVQQLTPVVKRAAAKRVVFE